MRKAKCRYCGAPAAQVRHEGLISTTDNGWRLFDPTPVPAATCAVLAVTRSPAGALVWANTLPDAAEVFPMHRCPGYTEAMVTAEWDRLRPRDDVEAFLALRPPPSAPGDPSRQRVTA